MPDYWDSNLGVDEMILKSLASKTFALLACLALLTSAFGCNSDSPMLPDLGSDQIVHDPSFIRILSTPKSTQYVCTSEPTSSVISAEYGGIVSNGWITLEFPPGALNEDTEISIDMPDPNQLMVDLSPHGIQFNKPVTLTLKLEGTDAEGRAGVTGLIWLNEDMDWWEYMEDAGNDDGNHSKHYLYHFSKYASQVRG